MTDTPEEIAKCALTRLPVPKDRAAADLERITEFFRDITGIPNWRFPTLRDWMPCPGDPKLRRPPAFLLPKTGHECQVIDIRPYLKRGKA